MYKARMQQWPQRHRKSVVFRDSFSSSDDSPEDYGRLLPVGGGYSPGADLYDYIQGLLYNDPVYKAPHDKSELRELLESFARGLFDDPDAQKKIRDEYARLCGLTVYQLKAELDAMPGYRLDMSAWSEGGYSADVGGSPLNASACENYLGDARQQLFFPSPEISGDVVATTTTSPELSPSPSNKPDTRVKQGKRIPDQYKKYMNGLAHWVNPETQRWELDEDAYLQLVEAFIRQYSHHGGLLTGEGELVTQPQHYDSYIGILNAASKEIADARRRAASQADATPRHSIAAGSFGETPSPMKQGGGHRRAVDTAHGSSHEEQIPQLDSAKLKKQRRRNSQHAQNGSRMSGSQRRGQDKKPPKGRRAKPKTVNTGCWCGFGK